jgi:hypothetical protein
VCNVYSFSVRFTPVALVRVTQEAARTLTKRKDTFRSLRSRSTEFWQSQSVSQGNVNTVLVVSVFLNEWGVCTQTFTEQPKYWIL